MSNFAGEFETTVYTEPEDASHYRGRVTLTPDFDEDRVGLSLSAYAGSKSVHVGIADDDVQQFLYEAAVRSKLIKDGEPLILMKSITADEDAA